MLYVVRIKTEHKGFTLQTRFTKALRTEGQISALKLRQARRRLYSLSRNRLEVIIISVDVHRHSWRLNKKMYAFVTHATAILRSDCVAQMQS